MFFVVHFLPNVLYDFSRDIFHMVDLFLVFLNKMGFICETVKAFFGHENF